MKIIIKATTILQLLGRMGHIENQCNIKKKRKKKQWIVKKK